MSIFEEVKEEKCDGENKRLKKEKRGMVVYEK